MAWREEIIQNIKDCGQSLIDSDCYFDECKDCLYREHNDDLVGCLSNRLGLAWHRLLKETPIINKFIDDYRYCHWYQKEE